ncbi:hypothetical protein JXA40_00480 [bacterium]|nr:hypothetical protein [candidate division CSSED10-310 bacterium]
MKYFRLKTAVESALVILPAAIYWYAVVRHSVNIPYMDDYDTILDFLNRWDRSPGMLFEQHNEHRIVFSRTVTLLAGLVKPVDLKWLVYCGNAATIVLFGLILRRNQDGSADSAAAIPAAFLFFSFSHWENMTWAAASLQFFYVALFSFMCISWAISPKNLIFTAGLAWGVLGSFTGGNGIVALIAVVAYYMAQARSSSEANMELRRTFPRLLLSILVTCAVGFEYVRNYLAPAHHPELSRALAQPVRLALYFFAFLGSYMVWVPLAVLAGIMTCLVFGYLVMKNPWRWNPVPYLTVLYVIGCAGLGALVRSGFGVQQAVTSRYRIFSILALCMLWFESHRVDLMGVRSRRRISLTAACLAVVMFAGTLFMTIRLAERRNELERGMNAYMNGDAGKLSYPIQDIARSILEDSTRLGIYHPEPALLQPEGERVD